MCKGVHLQAQIFLNSWLVEDKWSVPRPGRYNRGERAPGSHWIGGWVGNRASLDDVKKTEFLNLPVLEIRPLSRPARSQSLYRLHYPFSKIVLCLVN
jgi:hypothetical protein